MSKKLPYTPNSQIRSALRRLFLRSRERGAALKRYAYTCAECGRKKSRAKGKEVYVEVHHVDGVLNWNALFEAIRQYLLCDPKKLVILCKECHSKADKEG